MTLYFTTGLNAETDGLFGAITPAPRPGIAVGIAGGAGQDSGLGFLFSDSGGIAMAGNPGIDSAAGDEGSGVRSYPAATAPPVMAWSSPATAPPTASALRILPTMAASLHQDVFDQLFATLPSGDYDAAWLI